MTHKENKQKLRRLNEQIPKEENAGNKAFFRKRLAKAFAFHRVDGKVVTRGAYIKALKPGGRRTCDPRSIKIRPLGRMRSLVTCVVAVGPKSVDNARLFIKNAAGKWRLLAWANEEQVR